MAFIKRNAFVLTLVLLLALAAAALAWEARPADPGDGFRNEPAEQELVQTWPQAQGLSHYALTLALHPEQKTLTGTLDFTYVNAEDRPMGELHFLLYANSHRRQQYGIFQEDELASAYPNGFSSGSTDIRRVTSAGADTAWTVTGEQEQVLRVQLGEPVPPGGTAQVRIEYQVTIPNCYGRFGYGEHTMSLVNCYPVLSVYEDGQWHDYPYYPVGDPFFSEVADYEAIITAPRAYTLAATGVLTRENAGQDSLWRVQAPARRDFGFVASDLFAVRQGTVDGVTVRSYYLRDQRGGDGGALETAMDSLELFGKSFGPYPYGEYAVVQSDFFIGGMEYPGMVLIDATLYENSLANDVVRDIVVSHETAHQWWYGVVGGDEVQDPWLDEGLTEFSTQLFFELERPERFNRLYQRQMDYMLAHRRDAQEQVRTLGEPQPSVTLPTYDFSDGLDYSAWVYDRTAGILRELRREVGDEAFFGALREYYAQHRLAVTTAKDLLGAFERVSGQNLGDWFAQRQNRAE